MDANMKIRCPGCKKVLQVKTFPDGTYGEIVKEIEEPGEISNVEEA